MKTKLFKNQPWFWMLLFILSLAVFACNLPLDDDSAVSDQIADQVEAEPVQPEEGSDKPLPGYEAVVCADLQFEPVVDFNVREIPDLGEPEPRQPITDPVFGTCIIRVTDRQADLDPGDISGGMKNEYSRVQSFNADASRLIAFTTDGNWYLYDASSLRPIKQIFIWHEPRWDAEDPDLLYYSEDTRLMAYRIASGEQWLVREFADDFPGQHIVAVWTKYEGSPTFDSRYWGLMAEDEDWMTVAILIYDIETDEIVALRETPQSDIDSVTISPLGNYFLAYHDNYCEHGQLGSDAHPCGFMVYDSNLENGRGLLRIIGHSDPALDAQGNEVVVYQDIDADNISMVDLATGEVTPLWSIDFSHSGIGFHFSGRASDLPGWVLVSTSNGALPSATWMDDQIFAVELVKNGRVVRLGHTHSYYNENIEHDYWAEPHGSVNQDFTRIVFTSNWGRSGTDKVDMYMIVLPQDWVSLLP